MKNIFINVFNLQLCMSIVIVFFILTRQFFKKTYQAKMRYWVWLLIAVRLCMPFDLKAVIPKETAVVLPVQDEVIYHYSNKEIPKKSSSSETIIIKNDSNKKIEDEIENDVTPHIIGGESSRKSVENDIRKITFNISTLDVIAWIWASIAIMLFVYSMSQYLVARKSIVWQLHKDKNLDEALKNTKQKIGISDKVKIAKGNYKGSPMLIGIINPIIVLPDASYTDIQLEMILRHELCHLKRKDVWFKFLLNTISCIYWFNPLMYYMQKYIGEDIELSCDQDTVKGSDKQFKVEYAQTIMRVIAMNNNKLMFSTSFSQTAESIKERFTTVFSWKNLKKGKSVICAFAVLIMFSTSLVACSVEEEKNVNSPKVSTSQSRIIYGRSNGCWNDNLENCENELYFPLSETKLIDENTAESYIYTAKVDENGNYSIFCNKEGCQHNSKDCNAYIDTQNFISLPEYFTVNGKPYVFMTSENNMTDIYSVSEEGISKLYTFGSENSSFESAVTDGVSKIYITEVPYDKLLESSLYELNLETGEKRDICKFEAGTKELQAKSIINGNELVVITENSNGETVGTVNIETGAYVPQKFFSKDDIVRTSFAQTKLDYKVVNDKICVLNRESNQITLETIGQENLEVVVNDVMTQFDVEGAEVYQKNIYGTYGNMVVFEFLASSEEHMYGSYGFAINTDTKEIIKLSLKGNYEESDDLYVSAGRKFGDKMLVLPEYVDDRSEIAWITVDDYFSNKPNFHHVCYLEP